jgi:hypothetical protein
MFFLKPFFLFASFSLFTGLKGFAQSDSYESLGPSVYIDPDVGRVTVSTRPGVTWQNCKQNPALCVGWPDADSKIKRVPGSKVREVEVRDPATGTTQRLPYIEVEFQYTREVKKANGQIEMVEQKGRGWIEASTLRSEPLQAIYRKPQKKRAESSPQTSSKNITPGQSCNQKGQQSHKNFEILDQVTQKIGQGDPIAQLDTSVKLLKPLIGKCPLIPPNRKRADAWRGRNIYDSEVLKHFDNMDTKHMPKIPKETGPGQFSHATREDLINIDTLARTLYAEMNECFKHGLQYPMAVAKVALNRAQLVDEGKAPASYVNDKRQVSQKPSLAKVLTAPWQFSVWNPSGAANPNDKTALMALCPTRDNSKTNWKGHQAGPDDLYAWEKSLQIATEAVLYPHNFNRKTRDVTQFYYTSKRTGFLNQDYKRPNPPPKIEGRVVDSFQCMYLWEKN